MVVTSGGVKSPVFAVFPVADTGTVLDTVTVDAPNPALDCKPKVIVSAKALGDKYPEATAIPNIATPLRIEGRCFVM